MSNTTPRTNYPEALQNRAVVETNTDGDPFQAAYTALRTRGFDHMDAEVLARMTVNSATTPGDLPPGPLGGASITESFAPESPEAFGLYPIVDSLDQLARLLPLGLGMIQWRAKDMSLADQYASVEEAVDMSRKSTTHLYINDAWEAAIRHGAYGVHLGQDDLATADLIGLQQAGLRLGISSHSVAEMARAAAYRPSYIAIGTVFRTTSKVMDYAPLELTGFSFLASLSPVPVVAIGGIHLEQAASVYAAGADGIAVISEMRDCDDPATLARQWAATKPPSRA